MKKTLVALFALVNNSTNPPQGQMFFVRTQSITP